MVIPYEELLTYADEARAHVHIAAPPPNLVTAEGVPFMSNDDVQIGRAVHEKFERSISREFRVEHEDPAAVHQKWLLDQNLLLALDSPVCCVDTGCRWVRPVHTRARDLGAVCAAEAHELAGGAPFEVVDGVVVGGKPQKTCSVAEFNIRFD